MKNSALDQVKDLVASRQGRTDHKLRWERQGRATDPRNTPCYNLASLAACRGMRARKVLRAFAQNHRAAHCLANEHACVYVHESFFGLREKHRPYCLARFRRGKGIHSRGTRRVHVTSSDTCAEYRPNFIVGPTLSYVRRLRFARRSEGFRQVGSTTRTEASARPGWSPSYANRAHVEPTHLSVRPSGIAERRDIREIY